MSIQNKMGRPPRTEIDKLCTQVWFNYLRWHSCEWEEPTHLALLIEPDKCKKAVDGGYDVPQRWYTFGTGEPGPKIIILDNAESRFPGSKRLYDHPLWELLSNKKFSEQELLFFIRQLPPDLVGLILCDPDPVTGKVKIPEYLIEPHIYQIQSYPSLDALSALMAFYMYLPRKKIYKELKKVVSNSIQQLVLIHSTRQPFIEYHWDFFQIAKKRYFKDEKYFNLDNVRRKLDDYHSILNAMRYIKSDFLKDFILDDVTEKRLLVFIEQTGVEPYLKEANSIISYIDFSQGEPVYHKLALALYYFKFKEKYDHPFKQHMIGDVLETFNIAEFELTKE